MLGRDQRGKITRVAFSRGVPVRIVAIDGTWARHCVMLDAGETGAKLQLLGSTAELDLKEFFLLLSTTGVAFRRCELAWVNEQEIGVYFLIGSGKSAGPPIRPEIMPNLHEV